MGTSLKDSKWTEQRTLRTGYFVDQLTGAVNGNLVSFQATAGGDNSMTCSAGDIIGADGYAISPTVLNLIRHCAVYVTDGAQYDGRASLVYDYRARSAYY